jgi:hypothetical protein
MAGERIPHGDDFERRSFVALKCRAISDGSRRARDEPPVSVSRLSSFEPLGVVERYFSGLQMQATRTHAIRWCNRSAREPVF